jgi:hypothetical protein
MRKYAILSIAILFSLLLAACGAPSATPTTAPAKTYMKVNFYTIDLVKVNKGKYVGFAELNGGRLSVEVTDPKLEKILKSPYTTMAGKCDDRGCFDWYVTYQPGTIEHLSALAIECYRFGYIGEEVKK